MNTTLSRVSRHIALAFLVYGGVLLPARAFADDILVVDSNNGTILKVTGNGNISTYATGFERPWAIALDYEGNLFVSDYNDGTISKVTKTGVVTTFVSGLSAPTFMAFDSEGNLYVSNSADGKISKVTPKGQATTFVPGVDKVRYNGLAFGPDGNLYAVCEEQTNGSIVKITKEGGVSTFARVSYPETLAFDAQGGLFVTNHVSSRTMVKVSSTGEVSKFQNDVQSYALAFDSHNNLFMTGLNGVINEAAASNGEIRSIDTGTRRSISFGLACDPGLLKPGKPPVSVDESPAVVVTPASLAATAPGLPQFVRANNAFALDLYHSFNLKAGENAFFSPYAMTTALTLAWAGAKGQTATQIVEALHFPETPATDVMATFKVWRESLALAGNLAASEQVASNSLWAQEDATHLFLQSYLGLAQNDFQSAVVPVDFKNQSATIGSQINARVSEETGNIFTTAISPGDVGVATRLVLINATYFKGGWSHPFSGVTTKAVFRFADGTGKPVVLMNGITNTGYADISDGPAPCQVLSLSYAKNATRGAAIRGGAASSSSGGENPDDAGLSFVVILPRNYKDLPALEKAVTADQLAAWLGRMRYSRVNIFLPKFEMRGNYILDSVLRSLGIASAWIDSQANPNDSAKADFSGMNGATSLFFNHVVHQAYLNVDEKGTGAAAAGYVATGNNGARQAQPVLFLADHPFMFLIRDNATGSILFLGRFANPQ